MRDTNFSYSARAFISLIVAVGAICVSIAAQANTLAFDPTGNLFFADTDKNSIFKYSADEKRSTFATDINASGMAIDAAGNVFVTDGETKTIVKFTRDGSKSTFASEFAYANPFELIFDNKGNLFAAVGDSSEQSLVKFTPEGTKSIFATELSPTSMAFDSAGNLFVGDYRSHSIFEFSPDGKKRTFATGIGHAESLVFDHEGNLFVADWKNDSIFKINRDGTKKTFAPNVTSEAIALDKIDNLFVALPHLILKFAPDGKKTTCAKNIPKFAAFIVDKADNLLVADAATDSILRFTSDGTKTTFASAPPRTVSADEAQSPSPDGRFAFVLTDEPNKRAYDLIEKESGKVLLRVAESEADSNRLSASVLWSPDSQRFVLSYSTIQRLSSSVAVYFRSRDTFQEIELPKLSAPEIPEKLKRGKNLDHISALNYASAVRWQKDGSLVVEIANGVDGNEGSVSATRTVVLGFDRSGKARILRSTIKYEPETE